MTLVFALLLLQPSIAYLRFNINTWTPLRTDNLTPRPPLHFGEGETWRSYFFNSCSILSITISISFRTSSLVKRITFKPNRSSSACRF